MRKPGKAPSVIAVSALALACSTLLLVPSHAQYDGRGGYGGGGYGGGYDRPRRSMDEDFDRRRGPGDDFDRSRRGGGGGQASGSFVQSCREIDQDGAYLSASCRMRGGGYQRSRIDVRSCPRGIANNNGRLSCQ